MSQYGYYTSSSSSVSSSNTQNPVPTTSISFHGNEEDFEYDITGDNSKRSWNDIIEHDNKKMKVDIVQHSYNSHKTSNDSHNSRSTNGYSSCSSSNGYRSDDTIRTKNLLNADEARDNDRKINYQSQSNGNYYSSDLSNNAPVNSFPNSGLSSTRGFYSHGKSFHPNPTNNFNHNSPRPSFSINPAPVFGRSLTPPSSSVSSSAVSPELSMPVFQTLDKSDSWSSMKMRSENSDSRLERREEWAWSSGRTWSSVTRTKLHLHTPTPKLECLQSADRVSGGIGEKLLQKMGWSQGQGLGKTGAGDVDPVEITEIKTDRRGLVSQEDKLENTDNTEVVKEEKVACKFAVMKSNSFWSWYNSGMKGPDKFSDRVKVARKEAKARQEPASLNLVGKHPTSALVELCQKRGWSEPRFREERSSAGFRFSVEVNNQTYQPTNHSSNKKDAKKDCCRHCLETMGLIPSSPS